MDREGAETYLRLLAEAAMRGSLTPAAAPRAPNASTIMAAGHALTAVGALDPATAEEILTDFRLGRDRAAADPPIRRAGGDGGRVAHPGPGWAPAPEAGPGPVTPGQGALGEDPDHGGPTTGGPTTGGQAGSSRSG